MKVFEAPNEVILEDNDITCFLAGGISNCENWQTQVIKELSKYNLPNLVLINPRRSYFDANNFDNEEQIKWEFNQLEKADIFSMYFCNSVSVQPICMYELGRNLLLMQHKFKNWKNRIIITIEDGYSRKSDVEIQSALALGYYPISLARNPKEHALIIKEKYEEIKHGN